MRPASRRLRKGGLISVLLAFVLIAAACGDDDEPAQTTAAPTTAAPTTAAATTAAPSETTAAPSATSAAPTTAATSPPPPPPATGLDTLTVAIGQNPLTLDPQLNTQAFVRQIVNTIYDPLVWTLIIDGVNVQFPGLAERWEANADATEWTFFLRQGVTFHDGTPFDAEAVKFNFDRLQDPDLDAQLARGNLGPYERSEVIDSHTVKVVFTGPNALFIDALSTRGLFIGSPTAYQAGTMATNPVGTGAYIFEEFRDRQHVNVRKNPDWASAPSVFDGIVGPENIVYRILESGTGHFTAIQTGELDIAQVGPMSPQNMQSLEDSGFTSYAYFTRGTPFSWIFNMESPIVGPDVRVRQAISHGIDKGRLIETVLGGVRNEATNVFSAPTPGHLSVNPYPYDPTRAAQLLDEAGWVLDGDTRMKDGVALQLEWYTMTDFPVYDQMAPFVQAQLAELGIAVNITSQSWPGIGETLTSGVHDVGITSLTASNATGSFNAIMSCASDARQGGFNWSFYCNPAVDELMNAAAADPDPTTRLAAWEQASEMIMADTPYIPMVENSNNIVAREGLFGFVFAGVDGTPIYSGVFEG